MNQLQLHKKIDETLKKNPEEVKREEVSELMPKGNFDARDYFFAKADERWLNWLWQNKFLDGAIKKQPEDITRYGYQTPEIGYLVRMAKIVPEKVVKIILDKDTATSEKKFKPELVDQFSRICAELPAEYLVKVIPKIKRQNWLRLMSPFSPYGFEYAKMFETLYKAGEIDSLLDLAEVVLSIKGKGELEKKTIKLGNTDFPVDIDNPFYFKDASYIKVFDYLAKIEEEKYIKKAFKLVAGVMAEVVEIKKKENKNKVFVVDDFRLLLDQDFFEIDLKERDIYSEENIANLAAVMKILAEKFMTKNCQSSPKKVKEFFKRYIGEFDDKSAPLPDSRAMWRFRLFVLSLCPEVLKTELKKYFWRLFEAKGVDYYQIISGTEYKKALQKGFSLLSNDDKREYIRKVIKYFKKKDQEKENEKENWHLRYGSEILSVIPRDEITLEEKQEAEKAGFKFVSDYEPKPSIGMMRGGTVVPQGPISAEEFNKLSVIDVARKLKNEWPPERLQKKYKNDDFLRPRNAEGAGELLKNDIPKRFQKYIDNADKFFGREKIDPHYTYSFLRGIQETVKNKPELVSEINWDGMFSLFNLIKKSGEQEPFEEEKRDIKFSIGWLASWNAVHSAVVDVLRELLNERDGKIIIDFKKHRNDILKILEYLLSYPDPKFEEESVESAKVKQKDPQGDSYQISDPLTIAINTVRGRAFEAFVMFVFQDGKLKFKKDDEIQIDGSVKKLYEDVLIKENTRAIMFLFGRYLASFYFRDKQWIRGLLSQIFPEEQDKKYLFLASTEGYLIQSLYEEIFFDKEFQKLYEKWIKLEDTHYPDQKHFKDIDEALADHLALAFIYFSVDIDKDHLMEEFWSKDSPNRGVRHKEFISFVGRHVLSRQGAIGFIKEKNIDIKRLQKFWDWALDNISDKEVLTGFGYWVNPDEEVIEDKVLVPKMADTLYKSEGQIDWDYALTKRLPKLAEASPDNTLKVIRNYFFDRKGNFITNESRMPIYKEEYKQALEIIYGKGGNLKQETVKLINNLIEKGGRAFWSLEEIVERGK